MTKLSYLSITLLLSLCSFCLFAQDSFILTEVNPNCDTDFWTVSSDGAIQQWSLNAGLITGGDTVLTGGALSLAYCGDAAAPTFYTDNWNEGEIGINYYEPGIGWLNIPTEVHVQDNGGHLMDQYFTVVGGVIQYVNYWDGSSLTVIDSLPGEFFAGIFDIAVDTLGHAWVFTASSPGTAVDSLKVYDPQGQIHAYPIAFDKQGYGSFFLQDTLYIGTFQDSIFPVLFNGNNAELGTGIPFPQLNFTDMASCQRMTGTNALTEYPSASIQVVPNPSAGHFSIDLGEILPSVTLRLYDMNGRLLQSFHYRNRQWLDLQVDAAAGVYVLTLDWGKGLEQFRLLLE